MSFYGVDDRITISRLVCGQLLGVFDEFGAIEENLLSVLRRCVRKAVPNSVDFYTIPLLPKTLATCSAKSSLCSLWSTM